MRQANAAANTAVNTPGERTANMLGECTGEYVSECASKDASASVGLGQAKPTNRGSKSLQYEDDTKTVGSLKKTLAIQTTSLIQRGKYGSNTPADAAAPFALITKKELVIEGLPGGAERRESVGCVALLAGW